MVVTVVDHFVVPGRARVVELVQGVPDDLDGGGEVLAHDVQVAV